MGYETQGDHPAIVISNDKFNSNSYWKTVTVVPVSSSPTQAQRSYAVILPAGSGGLPKESVALCHQVTTIDRTRLGACYGLLDPALLKRVSDEIKTILYL